MRLYKVILVLLWAVFFHAGFSSAQIQDVELNECHDETLGITLLCNPEWPFLSEENVIMLILNDSPLVTATIAVSDSPVLSLKQLTNDVIQELGGYKDGFQTQMVQFGGQEAIQVAGVHKTYENVGLVDYYVIHDVNLYSILFSVEPKDNWWDYEELLFKIRDSIQWDGNEETQK
ncbi:MAG: hypothetical protein KC618_04960 [Candidatus Omnitrophica bacterium]|nr:hypothetical protein [Candidatus Omnitrophota bacterium]